MRLSRISALLLMSATAGVLVACEAAGTLAGGGARSDYLVARQALETGNYALANRRYEGLIAQLSPSDTARLQLEYAHSLLRADRFDDAIGVASVLVARPVDSIQASALAVRGTARHELARSLAANGQGDQARELLEGARDDLAAFLRAHASLDTAGSMRARAELIASDLGSL